MKIRFIFLAILSAMLPSCEQFVEVALPGQETKLVLNALLEPTDTIKVFLTKSRSVLEGREWENFEFVKNAQVVLKDQSGRSYPFVFKDRSEPWMDDFSYQLPNPGIAAGETYEVIAEAQGFPQISAVQEVPAKVQIKDVRIFRIGGIQNQPEVNEYEVTLVFDDLPGRNFYEISAESSSVYYYIQEGDTVFFTQSTQLRPIPNNPALRKEHLLRPVILLSDVFLSGSNSELTFRIITPSNTDVSISLSHVTEAYFKYYDSADLQYYNRGDFLAQPVLVFNNIKNGLGIFKARNTDRRTYSLTNLED